MTIPNQSSEITLIEAEYYIQYKHLKATLYFKSDKAKPQYKVVFNKMDIQYLPACSAFLPLNNGKLQIGYEETLHDLTHFLGVIQSTIYDITNHYTNLVKENT